MQTSNKLKILMCSEASFIKSGFGTYANEILSRLHKTGKYTIAEFASYGFVNDARDVGVDWIYYANAVKDDDPRHQEYVSRTDNQFGRWRFEKVLLDFKPDIVIDVRDYWMSAYQRLSPLRNYFHWILMPTVDSRPQQEEWLDTFLNADAIFTYSDWGADVLNKQTSGQIKYIDTASPGVDLQVFNIKDKQQIRNQFGLPSDAFIVGSVMRNQKRKLIPELFSSFRKLLDHLELNDPQLGSKTFLYLHTSYPDAGWNIPELLKDHRLCNRVLFSYICKTCQNIDCSVFKSPNKICRKCLNKSSVMPSVTNGVTTEQLAQIYNLFDLYVQYAICEGFGMPQVEAGACGIPIITVDYSAMCDVIHKLNAMPVRVQTLFKELETKALRSYPNNDDLIKHILDFMSLSVEEKEGRRKQTRQATEKHYDWDSISKIWEKYLDDLDGKNYRAKWNMPMIHLNALSSSQSIQPNQYFDACLSIHNNLNQIEDIGSMKNLEMLRDADYGFSQNGIQIQPYSFKNIEEYMNLYIHNNNKAEEVRNQNMQFNDDFIRYAKIKAMK
jgi:glycosyltransferase involved in cell wall biosynthesis